MQPRFTISDDQSKRLNILKLLMAIFVVYIHSNPSGINFSTGIMALNTPKWFELFKYVLSELIPRCAVPCFYLMAAIFLYRKDFKWKDNVAKKSTSLLVPYFIMNTVWIVIFAVCQSIPRTAVFFGDKSNIVAEFSVFRWFQAYGIGAKYPLLGPLWFMRNLFILNLLAPIIKSLIDRFPKVSVVGIIALYFLLPTFYYFDMDNLAMWCFGYLIVKYRVDINKFDDNRWIPIIYTATIIVRLILKDFNIIVLSNAIQRFSLVIGIIFWYSCFTKNFNGVLQRLFLRYSKYNFGIYIFHQMTLAFAMKAVAKVFGVSIYVQILEYLFIPLIIVILVIIFCIVLKKTAPKVFSLLTGARIQ